MVGFCVIVDGRAVGTLAALPSKIAAGTTVEYVKTVVDYPAPTWSLKLILQGASKLVKAAVAEGTAHKVTLDAADTAALAAGVYQAVEKVTHNSGAPVLYLADPQAIEVLPDFESAAAGALQDIAEKNLTAIRAVLAGKTTDFKSYEIAGRAVVTFTHSELIEAESYWAARVRGLTRKGRFDTPVRAIMTGSLRA